MKFLRNNRNLKVISLVLVVITIANVIMPIYSYAADEDEETGGTLFKPIFKLFAGVGDLVIKGLQEIFIGDKDITGEGISSIGQEEIFMIRYSPGIIFSNTVPGLDANFIKPGPGIEAQKVEASFNIIGVGMSYSELNNYGFSSAEITTTTTETDNAWFEGFKYDKTHFIMSWTDEDGVDYKAIATSFEIGEWDEKAIDAVCIGFSGIVGTVIGARSTWYCNWWNNWRSFSRAG